MPKSKKFGGRPKASKKKDGLVHIGFQITGELKGRVEKAAASNGRSISQEASLRLATSFSWQQAMKSSAVGNISTSMGLAFLNAGNRKYGKELPDEWVKNPASYRAGMFAVIDELMKFLPSQNIDDIVLEFEAMKGHILTRWLNDRDRQK